jgi:hypothetical protein
MYFNRNFIIDTTTILNQLKMFRNGILMKTQSINDILFLIIIIIIY